MTARATRPPDLDDPQRPPRTSRGTEAVRRRREARKGAWIAAAYLVVVAAIGTALWLVDRDEREVDGPLWALLIGMFGMIGLLLLHMAWELTAEARAWEAALAALTDGRSKSQGDPDDAILELWWNLGRDVARVSWDGVPVGRWWTTRGVDPGGRSWHVSHPTEPAPGHLERDHVVRTNRRGLAELRLDHRPYLLSGYGPLLVDSDGTEWSLRDLLGSGSKRTVGTVPRALGADGAVFVLRAHHELVLEQRRRDWSG